MLKCRIKQRIWTVSLVLFILFSTTLIVSAENNGKIQQPQIVKGRISDVSGNPLTGVNVILKGTTTGVISDIDGRFSIPVPAQGTTLIFSFIGYSSKEVNIINLEPINITLLEEALSLDEVVVVGYGTQKKRDLTGSVGAVPTKTIADNAVSGVGQALQGKLAGVQISPSSGAPSAGTSIVIRGQGTFGASSSPLVVIDGLITTQGLTDLDYNSIGDITVLKDASAAAIYGSRGANGVILITTKRGTADKQNLQLSVYSGINNVQRINTPVDNVTYANMMNEYFINGGAAAPYTDAELAKFKTTPSTNWQNEIYRTAHTQNYEMTASGGSKTNLYAITAGYYNSEGIVINDKFDRYNFVINNDITPFKGMKIGANLALSYGTIKQGNPTGAIGEAMIYPPTEPAYLENGNFGIASHIGEPVTMISPLINALMPQNKTINTRALVSTFAEYEIIKGLKFKTNVGVEYWNADVTNFYPTFNYGTSNLNLNATLTRQANNNKNLQWDNLLTYNKTLFGAHNIDVLVGYTFQESRGEQLSGYRTTFASNDPSQQILNSGSANDQARGTFSTWALQSYLGRLNYSFKSKYLFTANLRVDQSSRFPSNNRTGVFPSFSAGWVLSEEDFMKGKLGPVSFLKLRGSYGFIGNQDVGTYPYQTTVSSTAYYSFGAASAGTSVVGTAATSNVNSNISWEKTATSNVGSEIRFFDDKLDFMVDYYDRITSGILVSVTLPSVSGLSGNPLMNIGSVKNSGFEFTLNYGNMAGNKDFKYEIGVNLSTNHNEVIKLASTSTIITQGGAQNQYEYHTEQGHEINEYYGYVMVGIFQNANEIANWAKQPNAAPGDMKFKDLNGDNIIDSKDRKYVGSSQVHQILGFHGNVQYKNFDLAVNLNGEFGRNMYILTGGFNLVRMGEITAAMYNDRWTGEGTSNYVPRLVAGDPNNNSRMSTFWLRSQNYIQIQNLQFGYNLPSKITNKLKMQKLRVYVAGQNLYNFNNWPGYDPQLSSTGGYPVPRSIYFGCNIGF